MTNTEVMKKALEAFEGIQPGNMTPMAEQYWSKAISIIKQALAEPLVWNEPTPDFYISKLSQNTIRFHTSVHGKQEFSKNPRADCLVPVWFTNPLPEPTKQEWVGLTDEDIESAYKTASQAINYCTPSYVDIARVVETRLKEKNTKKG